MDLTALPGEPGNHGLVPAPGVHEPAADRRGPRQVVILIQMALINDRLTGSGGGHGAKLLARRVPNVSEILKVLMFLWSPLIGRSSGELDGYADLVLLRRK